jgi:PKD repeat protein
MKGLIRAVIFGLVFLCFLNTAYSRDCSEYSFFETGIDICDGSPFSFTFDNAGSPFSGFATVDLTLNSSGTSLNLISGSQFVDDFNGETTSWYFNCTAEDTYKFNLTINESTPQPGICLETKFLFMTNTTPDPNITITISGFPETNNRAWANLGQNYTINVTFNNTGDGNASNLHSKFECINPTSGGDFCEANDIILSFIDNNSIVIQQYDVNITDGNNKNYTFKTYTFNYTKGDGTIITSTASTVQDASFILYINSGPRFKENFTDFIIEIDNSQTYFDTSLNLDDYIYDFPTSKDDITWNTTPTINLNVSINTTAPRNVNVSLINHDWTGNENITFIATDPDNLSSNQTIAIYVNNGSMELCDGIDNNDDGRIDEEGNTYALISSNSDSKYYGLYALVGNPCCDYASCEGSSYSNGTLQCIDGQRVCNSSYSPRTPTTGGGGGSTYYGPTAVIDEPEEGDALLVNIPIQFKESSYPKEKISIYYWDFGDGAESMTQEPIHSYYNAGEYTVDLTVEDAAGSTDQDMVHILVTNCIYNSDCNDFKAGTLDRCIYGRTIDAFCQNCEEPCLSDSNCNDNEPLTRDKCRYECCFYEPCEVECSSNEDCNDGYSYTKDTCTNPGTCDAYCENTETGMEVTIIEPSKEIYHTKDVPLKYKTNIEPIECKYKLNTNPEQILYSKSTTLDAEEGPNIVKVTCDGISAVKTFEVDLTEIPPEEEQPGEIEKPNIVDELFDFSSSRRAREELPEGFIKAILKEAFEVVGVDLTTRLRIRGSRSVISNSVKNTQLLPLTNIKVKITIPKDIARTSDELIGDFDVIEEDPVIEFLVDRLEPGDVIELNYSIRRVIAEELLRDIETEITADKIPEEEIKKLVEMEKKTRNATKITTKMLQRAGKTNIKTTIQPRNNLTDVAVYMEIPKCLAEHIKDVKFKEGNYKIVKDDPLIVYHFTNLDSKVDLNYEVEGKISEECKKQIAAMPIAQYIGEDLFEEKSVLSSVSPLLFVPVVSFVIIFFSRFGPARKKESNKT